MHGGLEELVEEGKRVDRVQLYTSFQEGICLICNTAEEGGREMHRSEYTLYIHFELNLHNLFHIYYIAMHTAACQYITMYVYSHRVSPDCPSHLCVQLVAPIGRGCLWSSMVSSLQRSPQHVHRRTSCGVPINWSPSPRGRGSGG